MKYLIALLMLTALPAWADWVEIAVSEDGVKTHIDPTTIRKDGEFRKFWTLDNLPKGRNIGGINNVRSLRSRYEYDCKQERFRALSVSSHSEPNARGETLTQYDFPTQWNDIPPNSIGVTVLNRVCAQIPTGK